MAEAEEVQYPNNPEVAQAPAQVAPPAQEPQVPAAVPNEQRGECSTRELRGNAITLLFICL